MIKLKELLSLREMVYTHQVKPKHKDKMNRETKILEHNTFATLQPSPSLGISVTVIVASFKSPYSNLISQSAGTSCENS